MRADSPYCIGRRAKTLGDELVKPSAFAPQTGRAPSSPWTNALHQDQIGAAGRLVLPGAEPLASAIALKFPCGGVIGKHDVRERADPLLKLRGLDRGNDLEAAIEIARHEVGGCPRIGDLLAGLSCRPAVGSFEVTTCRDSEPVIAAAGRVVGWD
jgi:hypothetical protein